MRRGIKKRLLVLLAVLIVLSLVATPALAAERVLMKPPAKDAAFVVKFEGFKNVAIESFVKKYMVQEGLVIRQSRIENGKIVIPPGGLYYDVRTSSSNAQMLKGNQVVLLGKVYHLVDTAAKLDVIKNVEIKKGGGAPIGDGTKSLELTEISLDGNGFEAPKATFWILKPSGNFYGTSFPVATNGKLINIAKGSLNNGTGRQTGSYLPGEGGQNWHVEYYDTPVAVSGQSYLVVDEVTAAGAKVKEFATGSMCWLMLSAKPPVEMLLGKGETAALGGYTVKVTDITADSAAVELIAKDGKVTKKVLGPVNADTLKYMPADDVGRGKVIMRSPKEDAQVQLDVYRNPFRDGKVALVGYTDVVKFNNPQAWPSDSRFVFRPDT